MLAGREKIKWYYNLTAWLGWGAFAAALFDMIENYGLWRVLTGSVDPMFPQIAAFCATIKFILLAAGLLTALARSAVRK